MERMRYGGAVRTGLAVTACGALLMSLAACGGSAGGGDGDRSGARSGGASGDTEQAKERTTDLKSIPDVGDRLQKQIPDGARQVVAVYGAGRNSADSTVVLYTKSGSTWDKTV